MVYTLLAYPLRYIGRIDGNSVHFCHRNFILQSCLRRNGALHNPYLLALFLLYGVYAAMTEGIAKPGYLIWFLE